MFNNTNRFIRGLPYQISDTASLQSAQLREVSLAVRKISIAISTLTAVITPVTYARLCNIAPQAPNFKIRISYIVIRIYKLEFVGEKPRALASRLFEPVKRAP